MALTRNKHYLDNEGLRQVWAKVTALVESAVATLTTMINGKASTSDITNAINDLDVSDTAVQGKVVTAVSEANGKITVTRKGYDAYDKATSDFRDETEIITTASTGPSSSSQVLYRRPATALWNYIKGKSDAIYATQSALTARIPKVTGTDNAVVRFNGTEGVVQNSGVKVLDDDILITPNGQRVTENAINGTEGTLGAINFLNLSTTSTYRNQPIILQYVSRNRAGYVIVNLAGGSTAGNISSATVSTIVLTGSIQIYYKISNNILYLYYNKSENYDNMSITFLGIGQYQAVGLSLTWVNTIQSSTSGLTAATLLTFRANMYMDGYSKASSVSAITTSDTVKSAIGKLEKGLDLVQPEFSKVRATNGSNIATNYVAVLRMKLNSENTSSYRSINIIGNLSIATNGTQVGVFNINLRAKYDGTAYLTGSWYNFTDDNIGLIFYYYDHYIYMYMQTNASNTTLNAISLYTLDSQYTEVLNQAGATPQGTLKFKVGCGVSKSNVRARFDVDDNEIATTYMKVNPASIELRPGSSAGNGGFIDFHFNGSTSDYTSRIIELASGNIGLNSNKVTVNGSVRYKSLYVAGTAYTVTADDGYSIYRVSPRSSSSGNKFILPALESSEYGREVTIVCEGTGYASRDIYYIGYDPFTEEIYEMSYVLRSGSYVKFICGNGYWFSPGLNAT